MDNKGRKRRKGQDRSDKEEHAGSKLPLTEKGGLHEARNANLNQAKCIMKRYYRCTMKFYPLVKKTKIMVTTGKWMDLLGIMLNKVVQKDKALRSHVNPSLCLSVRKGGYRL